MIITCCRDCGKRTEGCHSSCPEYLEQRAKIDAEKRDREQQADYMSYVCRVLDRKPHTQTNDMRRGGRLNNA